MSFARVAALAAVLALGPMQAHSYQPGALPFSAGAKPPQRIVSINLCADQYLLALATPAQIAALSPFAADQSLSFYASRARGLPQIRDDAESVLRRKPDLVIASIFNRPGTLALLHRQGVEILMLKNPATLSELRAQIRTVAAAIGRQRQGRALLARLNAALKRWAATGAGLSALVYERGGYALGTQSLTGALIAHLGLKDAAARLGLGGTAQISLETVLVARPDMLIASGETPEAGTAAPGDLGAALLSHPVLARFYPPPRRLVLPRRLTVCPGPSTIGALQWLGQGIARIKATARGGG